MPDDLQVQISAAVLIAALVVFTVGFFHRRTRRALTPTLLLPDGGDPVPVNPPPLPEPQGLFAWRISTASYNRFDLPLVAFIVGIYSLPLVGDLFPAPVPEETRTLDAFSIAVAIFVQVFLGGLVIAFMAWRERPSLWLGMNWRGWPWVFLIAPVAVFLTWVLNAALIYSGFSPWLQEQLGGDGLQEAVKAFASTESIPTLVLLAFAAVVVAPVTEEILFRGYLYPVAKHFIGRLPAVVFSALIFGVAHHNAMAMVPLVFLAVLLVLSYEWTGSIWAPIGIHMLFNAASVAIQLGIRYGLIPGTEGMET